MGELRDLRAILRKQLETLRIQAFVYEADQGAHPDDPEQVSLEEVGKTDVFVLIIGDSWGEVTEKEYDRARELGKPCLVYERRGRASTDGELERFVKKLSGARGVPSRRSFETAVDLAEQVATDVQDWLVREYRRLSAAQLDAGGSTRLRTEIDQNIARLAASTTQALPSGTSADLLAWQLRQWFTAFDYRVAQEPESHPHWTDMIVLVPGRRGRQTRVFVRAKVGEIQGPDVDQARALVDGRDLDEVWLVSNRRISPAAKKAAESTPSVLLYTLDDLIEDDVHFEPYFEWLDKQVQAANLERFYVPLAVTVREVDADGTAHAESQYENVADYVDRWLDDAAGEHLSLLGEFGTGKSWFALKYAHDLVVKYRDAQQGGRARPRIPLVVRLREYARGFKDVKSLLTEFVFGEHQIDIHSVAVLETLDRMGRLLYIFDGFDEMAARVDQQKMVDNFWALAGALGPSSKAILTCRTEYFQLARQAQEVFGGKLRGSAMHEVMEGIRFQVATLQMFDDARLREVLLKRSAEPSLVEAILSNQRLADLGRRPVMVDLLIEAMPELKVDSADLSAVYYKAVSRKMARDISARRTFTSMADKMFFMCEVSWRMLSAGQLKIHYKEIPEHIRRYFGVASGSAEEDYWRHDLLSQTMLVRDDEGYYRPAHKSLIEFFSGYKLSAEIGALKGDYLDVLRDRPGVDEKAKPQRQTWSACFQADRPVAQRIAPLEGFALEGVDRLVEGWGRLSLNAAMGELMASLCGKAALLTSIKALASVGDVTGKVAARALEVAAFDGHLEHAVLSGGVFDSCRLEHCDLSGADLSGSNWNRASLKYVALDHATCQGSSWQQGDLYCISLKDADLSGCVFDEKCSLVVDVRSATWASVEKQEVLVAVLGDGRVFAISPTLAKVVCVQGRVLVADASDKDWCEAGSVRDARERAIIYTAFQRKVVVGEAGWRRHHEWASDFKGERIEATFTTETFAYGDVERMTIDVKDAKTGKTLLQALLLDTTQLDRGGQAATRALCLSGSGTALAVVKGRSSAPEIAGIIRSESPEVALAGFAGGMLEDIGVTVDTRGAAFSPSEALLAICERPNSIGFWSASTGALMGRAVFQPPALGARLDGAVGLSDEFRAAAADSIDGCRFYAPPTAKAAGEP